MFTPLSLRLDARVSVCRVFTVSTPNLESSDTGMGSVGVGIEEVRDPLNCPQL